MMDLVITLIGVSVLSVLLAGAAMWAVRAAKSLVGDSRHTPDAPERQDLDAAHDDDEPSVHRHPQAA